MRWCQLIPWTLAALLAGGPAFAQAPAPAAPPAAPEPGKPPAALTPQQRLLLLQEQEKALKQKYDLLLKRIQQANGRIEAAGAGEGDYEEKKLAELQMRDFVTSWALDDRIPEQMERLAREIARLEGPGGSPDLQRRLLLNFLRARREDYTRFAGR